uniref:Uncharacterized protein n=1 Tax=Vitis vinifera TaxID=29760 RepID=F6HJC6_VITVI
MISKDIKLIGKLKKVCFIRVSLPSFDSCSFHLRLSQPCCSKY